MHRTLNLKPFGDSPTTEDVLNRKSTQVHPRNFLEEVDPIQGGVTAAHLLPILRVTVFFVFFFFLYLSKNMTKLLLFKVLTKIEVQGCGRAGGIRSHIKHGTCERGFQALLFIG